MKEPEISVIVPVYNAERWLRRCVDSILGQTFADFELLLVDDGSTDASGAICDEYVASDPRVHVFHKPNGGVSSARNVGLDNAQGKWISFIDADDWIYPEMLQILSKASVDNEIVFFSVTEFFDDGTKVEYIAKECQTDIAKGAQQSILYLKNNEAHYPFFGFTWSKLFRRNIIEQNNIRFIDGFALYEDEIFTDEYCKNINSLKVLSSPLYCYSRSSEGLTGMRRKPEELLLLSRKLLSSYNAYIYEPLKIYELERSLSFLKEAIEKDRDMQTYAEARILLGLIESEGTHTPLGLKLKILKSFPKLVGAPLIRLYKCIK